MRSIEFKKSFDRSYRNLSVETQKKVDHAVENLLQAIEKRQIPEGLGLKRLQDDQWEIRVGIDLRVCFLMRKERIDFALVGSHDVIKKFLKNA